jgi:phosphoglycolate phosphatase
MRQSYSLTQSNYSIQPGDFLVFDLDGTISDPALGIGRCLNYSLKAFGFPELIEREVSQFIGPPLDITFRQITGSTLDALIADMVAKYRERYGGIGYAENALYPGISDAIHNLAKRQIPLGLCTSKRADFAEKILELFQMRDYFSFISGGDIGIGKIEQLRSLLENKTIGRNSVMIGDRAVDIHAARANGIGSVGVLWGHGSKKELQEAFPDKLLERPEQLKDLIGVHESKDFESERGTTNR